MNRLPRKKNARWSCPFGDPAADATITCSPSGREFSKSFVSSGVKPRPRTKLAAAVALDVLSVCVGAVVGGVVAGTSGTVADADDGTAVVDEDAPGRIDEEREGPVAGGEVVVDDDDTTVGGAAAPFDDSWELHPNITAVAISTSAAHRNGARRRVRSLVTLCTIGS